MKIAVIGNKEWQNKRKVQKVLTELKQKFKNELTIVGAGGTEGANFMIRKFALEFSIKYEEYNPSYTGRNLYSALPESYYGKSYHFSQLLHRMRILAENCDYMIVLNNENKMNPQLQTAYSKIQKLNKPVVILG
jgi:hypothetical protein|tara:strand:- start:914 stop:1315 length:402 start_codon:yes stop_codon:yes gene_type:complete